MSKFALAAVASLAALLAAQTAAAASHHVSERVFYPDLNLATPAGAKAVLKRIDEAATSLCAPTLSPVIVPPADAAATERCRSEAVARAVLRLRAPMVTAEYDRIRLQSRRMAAAN